MAKSTTPRLSQPLQGVIPPMVTPLSGRDSLDVAGLERLVEHILAGGVHGLFILGTTGEGPSLSYRLRRELIDRVCRQVSNRVPVLVGITDTSFAQSVELAKYAAGANATAAVMAPPCYFPLNQSELFSYTAHLAEELPLPLVLYNMPTHTKVNFDLDTLARLMEIPNIVGLKDSSGNMIYFQKVRQLVAQGRVWNLLIGPEELLGESVLLGGDGGISGGANVNPRLYVSLYEAARSRDLDRMLQLQRQVEQLSGLLYNVCQSPSAVLKGIKCALSWLGICEDLPAEPLQRCPDAERTRIGQHLVTLGLLKRPATRG